MVCVVANYLPAKVLTVLLTLYVHQTRLQPGLCWLVLTLYRLFLFSALYAPHIIGVAPQESKIDRAPKTEGWKVLFQMHFKQVRVKIVRS